ncbi:MAG: hypothetical protein JJ966_01950 [Balneolaceae bacterium]|jgi:uncharacterized repeat protein (TIGR01451 family)|nr:hypothetical protein [Balneolaceae bacterium]MCR9132808.1 hypothetical protein [bacterium]
MKNTCIFLTMMLLGFAANAMAQQNNGVVSVLEQLLVTVDENGQEILTPTEEAKPGDTLVYRVTYTNNLDNGITELRPVLPIPIGMEYLLESATPNAEGASLSNTGNTFQNLPLTRQVRQPDGTTIEELVPGREYRRLRWLVPSLEAGEQVILVARVKVIDN